LDEEDLPLY
jgi:hypothetical protein